MHRTSFRVKKNYSLAPQEKAAPRTPPRELEEIREQISNLTASLSPLKANVARLVVPKTDVSVPADIAASLGRLHNRLDKLEQHHAELAAQSKRMATTFSNAILKLADKVEKIAGGEDSSFSLAHSLEKLLGVLQSRKLRIIRDSNGDMVGVETATSTQD